MRFGGIILGIAGLFAQPIGAQPLNFSLPQGAELTASETLSIASHALPKGPFQNGAVVLQTFDAALARTAFRFDLAPDMTIQSLMADLRAQAIAKGYVLGFECHAAQCGGFDFRFALDLLPEPDMHVDLGDFRYFHAEKGVGETHSAVAVLVSKSPKYGFVHIAELGAKAAPAPKLIEGSKSPEPASPYTPGTPSVVQGAAFAAGKAVLEAGGADALRDLAQWLMANPAATAALVGHTDSTGKAAANTALSLARAETLRDVLIAQFGIDGARLQAQGQGGSQPIASNDTAEGRAQNRRVEVVISAP